ncbi:hypothetical protein CPB83DRAFT_778982, partial [Crepidotus variabilis]
MEQLDILGVSAKCSVFSLAQSQDFGGSSPKPPLRIGDLLVRLDGVRQQIDPWSNIETFINKCKDIGLSGVDKPFYEAWMASLPPESSFMVPDTLHGIHKMVYDHILQWMLSLVGKKEFDYRLSILQPMVGIRSWPQGISTLKQLTGRDHRAISRLIVAVAEENTRKSAFKAIRLLLEFLAMAQCSFFTEASIRALKEKLDDFHDIKADILLSGGRKSKGPWSSVDEDFGIAKLEAFLSFPRLIVEMGALYQYTTQGTEHCHVPFVRTPF